MTRYLLIILLLVILRLALKNFTAQLRASMRGEPPRVAAPPPPRAVAETLVPCAACGAFVPARRGLKAPGGGGEVYCSEECRTRGAVER